MIQLLPALLPDRPRPKRARGGFYRAPRSSSFLLPVEVVSRDKFFAGSFDIPAGWDDLAMEFIGPGGENLGTYGSLLGGGTTKVYDKVTDILSEEDLPAGGQPADQRV